MRVKREKRAVAGLVESGDRQRLMAGGWWLVADDGAPSARGSHELDLL